MLKTLSDQETQAIKYFDVKASTGDASSTSIWVDGFSQPIYLDMPGSGEVIDVGCGMGRGIQLLPDLQISKYFGIDPSVESIKYCQKTFGNLPNFDFAVDEIRTVGEHYPQRFSGFMLFTTLMHLPRSDLITVLKSLRECLLSGASGMISTPVCDGFKRTTKSPMADILLTLYTSDELGTALKNNGLVPINYRVDGGMVLFHVVAH